MAVNTSLYLDEETKFKLRQKAANNGYPSVKNFLESLLTTYAKGKNVEKKQLKLL